jgi:hypothetical protein
VGACLRRKGRGTPRPRVAASPRRFPAKVALLSLLLLLLAACVPQTGDDVYVNVENQNPKGAEILSCEDEGPPSFPAEDVEEGSGRVAQYGRKMKVRILAPGEDGRPGQTAEVTFLYPPLDKNRWGWAAMRVNTGEVPQYFVTAIAGMRVGGTRRIKLPRIRTDADAEPRRFVDAVSGAALEIPSNRDVPLEVTLLSVCKPKIVVLHSSADRKIVELWCR